MHPSGARCWLKGTAVLLLLAVSTPLAAAQTLTFRNQCSASVVVQVASLHRGVFCRDRPYLLQPGETTRPIALLGDKFITVFDAKVPNRALYQGTLPTSALNRQFL